MTIRAEAGGVDAADFAEMLMRMYLRWAERHSYPTEVYDTSYAEEAGIKSATFPVSVPVRLRHACRSSRAPTAWSASRRSTTRAGGRRRSRASRCCRSSTRSTTSTSPRTTSGSTSTARRAPAGSASTRPTPPCASPTSRPASSSPARTRSRRSRTARPRCACCSPALLAAQAGGAGRDGRAQGRQRRLVGQPDAVLRAAPVPDGQGPADRARDRQHPVPSSTARSTTSSRPASAGASRSRRPADRRHPGSRGYPA